MKGKLIVITGIDGSGKTTQAKMLAKYLRTKRIKIAYVWSKWEPFFAGAILKSFNTRIYLSVTNRSEFYTKKKGIKNIFFKSRLTVSLWLVYFLLEYSLLTFLKVKLNLLRGINIISDRSFYDSFIDQLVNLENNYYLLENILNSFFVKMLFPQPDLVFFIDCPEEVAFSRKDDTPDLEYLKARTIFYQRFASKYGWIRIAGTKSIEEIATELKSISQALLKV